MRSFINIFVIAIMTVTIAAATDNGPAADRKSHGSSKMEYPKIVIYSVSWCSHCQEAKEYLQSKNIRFENRDVETDSNAMEILNNKYQTSSVPVVVIGDDDKVLIGFTPDEFEKAVAEAMKRKQP